MSGSPLEGSDVSKRVLTRLLEYHLDKIASFNKPAETHSDGLWEYMREIARKVIQDCACLLVVDSLPRGISMDMCALYVRLHVHH